jgi:hypothetical protein
VSSNLTLSVILLALGILQKAEESGDLKTALLAFERPEAARIEEDHDDYLGSVVDHEYPDLRIGDEVNPSTFLCSSLLFSKREVVFGILAAGGDTHIGGIKL